MSVFAEYARYYDLIYQDKDFEGESCYVNSLVRKFAPDATDLLDIGCGSGRHAEQFSSMGFRVAGLDRSEEMISQAKHRNPEMEFKRGDLCSFRFNRKFDVITALFHVVSYLSSDQELQAAIKNVRQHLRPGGVFVFDCWHGPAVEYQQPEIRIKRIQNGPYKICRIAEPRMFANENIVEVNFQVFVKENLVWDDFKEKHTMRYLFRPEIESLLTDGGLRLVHAEEWVTGKRPGKDTWGVVYVAVVK